jgi:prepilin-type processing-associated H-X9-DG protein
MVTEHRNDGIAANGHKGTSGFAPSQPCTSGNVVPYPPSGNNYCYFTADIATTQLAIAAKGGYSANPKSFKNFDILRVAWDRHTGGQGGNYSFADGHSKYQALGATLNPQGYEYGDRWYPSIAAWGSSSCK